nr:TIGR04028 family ABC transporter substrate-binding protein [Rothia santali]
MNTSRRTIDRRQLMGLGLGASSLLALSACSPDAGEADAVAETTTPRRGGVLIYFEPQTFTTLFPPQAGFYANGGIVNNIADRLLYQDPETLELHPWIASELPEVNDDATEFTFRLRPGVTYSDGSALTAANVVKNFDLYGLGDKSRQLPKSEQISNYERGEVLNESTVRFHFAAPSPGFAQAVSTMNAGLLSDASLDFDSTGFGPGQARALSASGPFVVDAEEIGTRVALRVREDYDWAPPHFEHQGRAHLDGIDYVVNSEYSVRIGALVSGQADGVREIEAPDEPRLRERGVQLHAAGTNGVDNGLNLRFRHELLRDVRVRRAIISAVDRESIMRKLFTENYPLATGVLAETAAGYKDYAGAWAHDPEASNRLLDEAGWTREGDAGVRSRDGRRLSLRVNTAIPQPRSREVMSLVQQDLLRVGVDLQINEGDYATQNLDSADLDKIQLYHSMVGRADYDVLKSQYSGENRDTLLNLDEESGEYGDPELEELLGRISSEPTADLREAASWAAQDHLVENAYLLPFFEEPQVFAFRERVRGFRTEAVARPQFYDTWLAE